MAQIRLNSIEKREGCVCVVGVVVFHSPPVLSAASNVLKSHFNCHVISIDKSCAVIQERVAITTLL